MNTTAPKKSHIYKVEVARSDTPLVRVYVRAESLAQARSEVATTMITVVRATTDELLDLNRNDVIDATVAADPKQETLPLPDADSTEPFGDQFLAGIDARNNPEG